MKKKITFSIISLSLKIHSKICLAMCDTPKDMEVIFRFHSGKEQVSATLSLTTPLNLVEKKYPQIFNRSRFGFAFEFFH